MKALLQKIRQILKDRRTRRIFTRVVSGIAAFIVFVTTYALVLPAITMESEAACGIQAHQHDDSCYEEVLTCGQEESDGHQHTDACYERVLTCGLEAHTHSAACYSHASEGEAGGSGASSEDYAVVAATTEAAGERVSMPTDDGDDSSAVDTSEIDGGDNIAVDAADTGLSSLPAVEDAYVPELEPLFFDQILTQKTGIYYFHPEEGKTIPENSVDITEWTRANDDTELAPTDILRVYLRYTIPAGSLNSTNPVARYRLPSNLHLTDEQMEAINTNVNGIANQYVNLDTLEILDPDQYNQYLGIEAVEGTRTPADDINEYFDKHPDMNRQEYISATVQAENVYDTEGLYGEKDAYLGQDLIFTFTPYTVQKNQHEYDADGQPTKAGEKVNGWLCFDVQMDQIDWGEPVVTTETVEEAEDTAADTGIDTDADNTSGTDLSVDPAANADEVSDTDANVEQETESAPVHQNVIELKESNAEILFAAEDKSLKIDEISTNLRMIERTEVTSEEDADKDQDEDTAVTEENGGESDLTAVSSEEDTENSDQTVPDEADGTDKVDESGDEDTATETDSAIEINAETYPAVSFEDSIVVRAGSLSTDNETAAKDTPEETTIIVSVAAEPETFPLGTTMVLGAVDDMDTVASAVEGAVEGQTRGFHAVDISFHNADGEEIEPLKPIRVSMTSEAIKQAVEDSSTVPVVMHVENPADSAMADNVVSDSVTGDNAAADAATADPAATDSASKDDVTKDAAKTDAVSNEADSATDMTDPESASHAEDNASADGSPADSSVRSSAPSQAESNTSAPTATIVETNETTSTENSADKKETADTLSFDAGSFSVYAIVYTVDFHWEVDGRNYTFTLAGGDSVSLRELVDVLGVIEKDDEQNDEIADIESDETAAANILSTNDNPETDLFIKNVEKVEFSDESLIKTVPITENVTAGELKKKLKLKTEYSADLTEEQIAEMAAKQFTPPDWALMVVKHFSTEETLTVTMKDGAVWTIRVTDPVTNLSPENMQVLNTEDTRSQGIKMWLFDYDLQGKLDHQDNKSNQLNWNIPNTTGTENQYGNYGINSGSDLKFLGWGAGTSYSNLGSTGAGINDFTGLDDGNNNNYIRALQGIVKNELEGGYPVLNNGQPLAYLFDPTASTGDRTVYGGTSKDAGNVTGLFEKNNSGYYIYDSDEHYAELGSNGKNITVYTSTLAQTDKNGKNHNPVRAVGFFPFNTYYDAYHKKYENDPNNYGNNGTMYLNPDGVNGKSGLNHHLGVAMEMNFVIPKGGKDENGNPIKFNFSGDDDMWVFIDDQLVLDIGGLHQPVDGTIDFSTGVATITGKATTNTSGNNTGSNAIATVSGAIDPRGNDFQFYPALGMSTIGDGKTHTMKIFYLERGGCDSNCMISFNLPLVKGRGEVKIAKYDSTANPVAPLSGVKFGIYSDPQCREEDLIEEVTSSSAGLLDFSDLGIKDDNQKYYIKETKPLPGYKLNDTVYTLKAKNNGSNGYTFDVYVYNADGVYNTPIDTIGDQPARPVIYNEERKPIDLTVEKVWQKPTMEAFTPKEDDNLSATFKVQRYVRSEGDRVISDASQPVTFKVYRIKDNSTVQVGNDYTFKGGTDVYVNWQYANGYYNNGYSSIMHYKENINDSYKNKTDPVVIHLPQSGTANIYIRDENIGHDNDWGPGVNNITVNGTPYNPQNTTEHFSTDWVLDSTYNNADTCPKLSLPENPIDENDPWKGKFSNLPLYETKGDTTYYYKYFIIETNSIDGYETIYVDGDDHQIENPSSLATEESNTSEPQKIINRKLMDIPVEKTWPDYDDAEYTWQAKFQLDYRNVPLDGSGGEDEQEPSGSDEEPPEATTWPVYKPAKYVEISKGDTEQKYFEDLPMYFTDENGVTWRREYSVRETEYSVWKVDEHGTKIEPPIVSKGANGTTGFEYTLWYRQDAGEDYNNDGVINEADYVISVENKLAHREVERKIDININKTWPTGTDYAISEDAKAIFKLKRYVVEEYRNYETVSNNVSWVDITLKTGDENDQILRVPQGQDMYIRGYLKGGTKDQNITFSCSAGSAIPAYSDDNSSSPDQKAFSIRFTADISKTVQLQSGEDYVSGGKYGFHLSDTNSMLPAEVDRHFSEEFELNTGNDWQAAFEDLPLVEVVQMNDGKTATTFVYSYFFEEIECVPESFYPTFTNSNGQVLLGDENNRIVFGTDITANNLPIGFDILKVDITDNSRKLAGAEFTLRKLYEDNQLHYPVPINNGIFPGTSVGTSETVADTGKAAFSGLLPGYYEVSETKAPAGYILLDDAVFYLKVEKSGDIKLLKKQTQNETVTLIETAPGEMTGNATLASSLSPEGRTIEITVRNEPGAALPNTGGPGTTPFTFLGVLATATSGTLLVVRKKRRRRKKA